MATSTVAQEFQGSVMSTIHKGQEITLNAIKVWVDAVEYFTPRVSYRHLPFANLLPQPHAIVAGSFGLAEQVLGSQRRFADDVLKVAHPLLPGEDGAPAHKD